MSPYLHVLPQPEALLQPLFTQLRTVPGQPGRQRSSGKRRRGKAGPFTHGFTWPHKVLASVFFTDEETKAQRGQLQGRGSQLGPELTRQICHVPSPLGETRILS